MKLTIDFTDGHNIKINLHDSMTPWAKHVEKLSGKYKYGVNDAQSAIGTQQVDAKTQAIGTHKTTEVYQILLDTIEKLQQSRPIGFDVPKKFTHDQEVLNKLHRYFTDSSEVVDQKSELFEHVLKINYCVHELEDFTSSRNKVHDSFHWIHICDYPIPMDCWIDLKDKEQENYKFLDYNYEYAVRLDRSILGKCVLQAYEENDDPNAKDCTGRSGSFGGFFIDTNRNLKDFYQSNKFNNWCKSHGRDTKEWPLEFVIGNVEQFSDRPEQYRTKTLAKLHFDNLRHK